MGNSNSRSKPQQTANPVWERNRINELNNDITSYRNDNNRLRNEITNLHTNIKNTITINENNLTRLRGKRKDLNNNILLTTDSFNRIKSTNADPTNLRMTEITEINDNLQKDTLSYMLLDVNTKKNIYNLIKSQNDLIEKNRLDLLKNTDKNNQKFTYSLEQYNEIENINTIFLILYYFLFIIFLFFIIFKINYPVLLKIIIGLIFLLYPFIIYTIETTIYNIIYSLYLYTFSIFTIENIY